MTTPGQYALTVLDNLVGYWPLGESSGDALDGSTNNNDGTVTIGAGARDEDALDVGGDGSILFDGADTKITIPDNSAIQNIFDSGGSLFFMIHPDGTGENDEGRIIDKAIPKLLMNHAESLYLLKFIQPFSGALGVWKTATDIPLNKTVAGVLTYNADSADNDPIMYIYDGTTFTTRTVDNGLLTENTTPPSGTRTTDVGNDLIIGNRSQQTATFGGRVDNIMLFSDILTAEEAKIIIDFGIIGGILGEAVVGVTHDVVINKVGFMTVGIPTRSDITSAIPRVSIGTEQRKATDLSELDTFGQSSWHHGRGQVETFDDPNSFSESEGFITWLPNVLVSQLEILEAFKTGGSATDFDGYASSIIPFQGNLYKLVFGTVAAGNALYIFDNPNTEFDTVSAGLDTSSGEPRQLHAFDSELYVAQGETVNARHFDGTSSWTDLGVPAKFFATFGNNDTNFLWRVDNLNELYFSPDPDLDATAFWNGPILVGDTTYPIRGILAGFQGALWVIKDDGVYAVTFDNIISDFVVQQVIDLSAAIDSNNGVAITEFGGNLFFSVGHTVYRYDGSTIQIIGPDRGQLVALDGGSNDSFQAGALGKVVMLTHDENFLYAAIDGNGKQESRIMVWGGTGWHTLFRTTDAGTDRIQSVFFTSALSTTNNLRFPTIWWSNNDGEKTQYQKQSRFSTDPRDDSLINHEPKTNELVTSWFDAGLPEVPKTFIEVLITFRAPTGSDSISPYFQTDDDPTWHLIDSVNEQVISGTIKMRLPDNPDTDLQDIGVSANKIRFKFDFTTANTSLGESRYITSWATRFVVRPVSRYGWNMTIKSYNNLQLLNQSTEQLSSQEIRDQLYQMRDSFIPLKFNDGTALPAAFNICRSPSLDTFASTSDDLAQGWTKINAPTTSLSGQYKVFGAFSQLVDATANDSVDRGITNSTFETAATSAIVKIYVYLYLPVGSDTFHLQIHDGTSVLAERAITPLSSNDGRRFVRYSLSTTVSSTVTPKIRIIRKAGNNTTNKTIIYVDGAEIYSSRDSLGLNASWLTSESSEQPLYIDGDQPRCFWLTQEDRDGAARQEGYFVYVTGISEAFRYEETRPGVGKRIVNSEITLSLREVQ